MLKKPSLAAWAFLCRSLALAFILYQMRLFAGEIADTPVFLAMLLAGFVFPLLLSRLSGPARDPLFDAKTVPGPFFRNYAKTLPCLLVLALVPWAARFLIAAPRWAFSGTAVTLDSLLLNFDRNTFVSLLPFYWAAFSTWGILRARRFLKADIAASDLLFFVLFCFRRSDTLALYRWPVLMIALFAFVFFLQLSSLCLASPRALRLRAKEAAAALAAFLVIALLGSVFLVRPSQEKAAEQGGGLLQPNMFNFDFSQVLRLDPEISMNNDLMLIVKKENADAHIFLRRYTLSEYSAKRGFYRGESDERAHPQNLPDVKTALPTVEILEAEETPQEYYLVNFDSNAFIGMNMPVEVTPFERWDASSFSAAYAVRSLTSSAVPFDLMEAVRGTPGKADLLPPTLGLSEDEYRLYTDYGGNKKIADYAEEICWQVEGYWDRILAVYDHLKNGDYRYSLRPGIAPDGDQLSWFLFQSKKGYCSYFAYAFSLLLRSMGVPCRAAAGFFINPEEKAFDYYPVSANMAHAWVEVWYPGYGWIEYDPTTELLADGEEFRFAGPPTDIFEKLMKEILENRSRLRAKEGAAKDNQNSNFDYFREAAVEFFRKNGLFVLAALIIILFLTLRLGPLFRLPFARGARKKARLLWAQALRVLALAGYRRRRGTLEPDWARGLASAGFDLAPLHESVTASRFAPAFEKDDARAALAAYRAFASSFRAMVPLHRRVLGWALPPLALLLRPAKKDAGRGGGLALLLFAVI
ncbi:MAG: transglutaminase-like domain-containing protein, partial [Treponema sp.]|nr:transglutaminase-like domain-containing protein [Treponema sp.]